MFVASPPQKNITLKPTILPDFVFFTQKKSLYLGCALFPVTVTTRIITFLVGNPNKASFTTVSGRGPYPTYTFKTPKHGSQRNQVSCCSFFCACKLSSRSCCLGPVKKGPKMRKGFSSLLVGYTLGCPHSQDATHHQDYYIFSREVPYKPSFVRVTGRGDNPSNTLEV